MKQGVMMFVMCSALFLQLHAAMATLNDGLVAHYLFNDNANDATGHGYDGTVYGATLTHDRLGHPNSAYSFDGMDDSILIGQEPNFPAWNTYAVSVWFLNNGGGDQGQRYGQKVLSKAEFFTDFRWREVEDRKRRTSWAFQTLRQQYRPARPGSGQDGRAPRVRQGRSSRTA